MMAEKKRIGEIRERCDEERRDEDEREMREEG